MAAGGAFGRLGDIVKNLYGEKRTARTQQELNGILDSHERFAASNGGMRAQLPMSDLTGLNLANRTLSEADFTGASLVDANLFGTNFKRASFYCADLQRTDLRNTNLCYADMRGASLKGANLAGAKMDNADLRAAMMMYVAPDGSSSMVAGSEKGPQGVDFTNCSLKHVSFGNAKLDDVNFSGAILHGAVFRGAKLKNACFKGAVLTGVHLKDLDLPPDVLKHCITDPSEEVIAGFDKQRDKLDSHQHWIVSGGKEGHHCVLDGEDIRLLKKIVVGRPLTGLSARNAVGIGLNFAGCQLQGARFDGADLRDADFSGADLRGASFRGARLSHARFDKADLRSLPLTSGQIRVTDFNDAIAVQEQFATARFDSATVVMGLAGQIPTATAA
ncbi:MAG TPA: pentapeptide repeat-containing protein [Rhizomicrobium sp.]|nr:pentapeptide repeat-containing protein [Rhizomicrobium sp.]